MIFKTKPKILLFEDDHYTGDIYETKFSKSGFSVKLFPNYRNVVENVLREKPDIVCCDLMMPTIDDGYRAIKALTSNRDTSTIPLLVLTNLDRREEISIELGKAIA